jgi:hypothetical protein
VSQFITSQSSGYTNSCALLGGRGVVRQTIVQSTLIIGSGFRLQRPKGDGNHDSEPAGYLPITLLGGKMACQHGRPPAESHEEIIRHSGDSRC